MRCRQIGWSAPLLFAFIGFSVPGTASAQAIHRNGFEGKQPFWQRGESNVKFEEKSHSITDAKAHRGTTSEQIIIGCEQGKNDNNFAYYTYRTPRAPITDELAAGVYVRANRAGVQLLARLVLPRERDPDNIGEPLTVLLPGDVLKQTQSWQRLDLPRPKKLVQEQQQRLRREMKRDIDLTDAYIDRLVLNLYTGPGSTEVQIDDLEISPVVEASVPAPALSGETGGPQMPKGQVASPGSQGVRPLIGPDRQARGRQVSFEKQHIQVDGQPFFPRIFLYDGGPMKDIKDAGFNAVYLDANADRRTIDEAIGNGLWVVPQMPLLNDGPSANRLTGRTTGDTPTAGGRETEALTAALAKFGAGDEGVLFYDLGPARGVEQLARVSRTAEAIRATDPNRPRSAEVWDGIRRYSTQVEMIGLHRNPLLTSLELTSYRDFLTNRSRLAGEGVFTWSWVQTHVPDWQVKLLYGKETAADVADGFSPTPEQIRILTYLSIAGGSKGIGFWSDRSAADPRGGRERMLTMSLLNAELTMVEPILQSIRSGPTWHDAQNNGNVKFAVLRGERGILVLPIWMGPGTQLVPPQGAVADLTLIVPLVPTSMSVWEISPGRVRSLQKNSTEILGGTKVVLPEFDLTSAIVFTNDQERDGLVARWQDHSRKVSRQVAECAVELAGLQYARIAAQYRNLEPMAPPVEQASNLLARSQDYLASARESLVQKKDELAYSDAMRALRPLRILMRAQWETATKTLDFPTASPYAASYQTLAKHYRLQEQLNGLSVGSNALADGDFRNPGPRVEPAAAPKERSSLPVQTTSAVKNPIPEKPPADVYTLPQGWTVQQASLDGARMEAALVPGKITKTPPPEKPKETKRDRYLPSSMERIAPKSELPMPELGAYVLRLHVDFPRPPGDAEKKAFAPSILERTFLAAHSPAVRLQPGTWVRISGWVYIAESIGGTADGLLIYDSAAGEGMGYRQRDLTKGWKPFHMYRQVPDSGTIRLSVAMTGVGLAFVHDLKIEPYTNGPGEK